MTPSPLSTARATLQICDPFLGAASLYLQIEEKPLEWFQQVAPWTEPTACTDGDHIFYYAPFIESLTPKQRVFVVAHETFHCFPGTTPIMTRRGLVAISEVKRGDWVYSQSGMFTPVKATMNRWHTGDILRIHPQFGLPFEVTPEHPVLTLRERGTRVLTGRRHHYKVVEAMASQSKGHKISKFLPAGELDIAKDFLLMPLPRMQAKKFKPKKIMRTRRRYTQHKVFLNPNSAYFLGFWVGDGTLSMPSKNSATWFKPSTNKRIVSLACSMKDDYHRLVEIIEGEFMRKVSVIDLSEDHRADPKQCRRLMFSSASLAAFLRREFLMPDGITKTIPQWMMAQSDEIIQAFVAGLLASDGHVAKARSTRTQRENLFTNTSMNVVGMLPLLLLRMGIEPRISRQERVSENHQTSYTIGWFDVAPKQRGRRCRRYWAMPIRSIERVPYDDAVYNIETGNNTYVLPFACVHNCIAQDFLRRGDRDPVLLNIAGDYRIHSIMREVRSTRLPQGWEIPLDCLYDAKYNGMSMEEIYALLKKEGKGKGGAGSAGKQGFGGVVITPQGANGQPLDANGIEAQSRKWAVRAAQCAEIAKAAGSLSDSYARMVEEVLEPKVPWQEVLRRFIRDSRARLGDDYQWLPANRRYLCRGMVMPSRERIGMGLLDIHVDLSGSIGQAELDVFAGEIRGIQEEASPEMTRVIYFDTAVNRVDLLGPEDRLELNGVRGGGGTDLGAAFRWAEKSGRSPVVTVVLTDLYGPFDLKVPHAPVSWCVSKGGARGEVPYGSCVRIED